jgi:hypothetical protein
VGPRWGLLTLAWWLLPPAFLTRLGITPWNYIVCVAWASIILYLTHQGAVRVRPARHWYLLGVFWGLAVWDHLISVSVVLASATWLAVRALRRDAPGPGWAWVPRGAAGFLVGNAPFWGWNLLHHLDTLTRMVTPQLGQPPAPARLEFTLGALAVEILGQARHFWADPLFTRHQAPLVALVYGPLLPFGLYWLWRGMLGVPRRRGDRPASGPVSLDLLTASLVLALAQVALSRYSLGRYLMPLYASVPVLLAAYARWLAQFTPWLPATLAGLLVVLHGTDNLKLLEASIRRLHDPRPVDAAIRRLREEAVTHVYAHYRVAWPLAFESGETIRAADFHGYLTDRFALHGPTESYMAPFFRDMAEVDAAPRVALVTHEALRIPTAAELAASLAFLGGTYRRSGVGLYTIFHDFRAPDRRMREVLAEAITLRASHGQETLPAALDRNIVTRWDTRIPQAPGMALEAHLDRPRRLAKIVLDPGSYVLDYPRELRVEISPDGATWQDVAEARRHVGGIDWLADHPKLNVRGKMGIWLEGRAAKAVRLTQIGSAIAKERWSVAELLLFEEDALAPARDPSPALREGGLEPVLRFLAERGVRQAVSSDEASVLLTRVAPRRLRTVALRDQRFTPVQRSERVVRFDRPRAFVLATSSPALEDQLRRHGVEFGRHAVAGTVVYVTQPAEVPPLYWDHGRLFALTPPG